jgi:hypothetical protein
MDQEMLKRHLAEAEEHIATGKNIARQRDLIAQLERDGHDTASAKTFLREFEQLQAMHIAEREQLLRELHEISNTWLAHGFLSSSPTCGSQSVVIRAAPGPDIVPLPSQRPSSDGFQSRTI